jgi:hypothetical protein
MFILLLMNNSNKVLQKLVLWIECLCCLPITLYGLYLGYKNPSYKYDITLDQPTIRALNVEALNAEALIDHYI